jgi:hypothetical protein
VGQTPTPRTLPAHQAAPRGVPSLRYLDPEDSPDRSKLRSLALAARRGFRSCSGLLAPAVLARWRSLRLRLRFRIRGARRAARTSVFPQGTHRPSDRLGDRRFRAAGRGRQVGPAGVHDRAARRVMGGCRDRGRRPHRLDIPPRPDPPSAPPAGAARDVAETRTYRQVVTKRPDYATIAFAGGMSGITEGGRKVSCRTPGARTRSSAPSKGDPRHTMPLKRTRKAHLWQPRSRTP